MRETKPTKCKIDVLKFENTTNTPVIEAMKKKKNKISDEQIIITAQWIIIVVMAVIIYILQAGPI